jgi:hypothetical protein
VPYRRTPCVAMRSASDCRRRRRGPQVRQERGQADQSIARSASTARGTPPLRVGNDVGVDVGNDVGSSRPGRGRPGRDRQGCGACQRSSTRRRRVPSPPPTVAGTAWSRAVRQGRMAAPWGVGRWRGAGHSSLTAGIAPRRTTGLRASRVASMPGGDIPRLMPSSVVLSLWARRSPACRSRRP